MFSDEVKLSKGLCYLVIAVVIIFNFLFLFGALVWFGHTSQPELNAVQIQETREDVKRLGDQLSELQKMLSEQAIKDAEIKGRDFGYRVGRTDKEKGH